MRMQTTIHSPIGRIQIATNAVNAEAWDGAKYVTFLWLKNLPPLQPTHIVAGRENRIWLMPPGPNRWRERSRTYSGIAQAMANQWGTDHGVQGELFGTAS